MVEKTGPATQPSAPVDETPRQASSNLPPAYNILDGQPNPQQQQDGQAPPPSYEEALNTNPYPGYQPNIFPKPTSQPPQNIVYPHYNATGGNAAPAASIYAPGPNYVQTTTATVVHPGGNCPHCLLGDIQQQTDICCLLCLLLLTIFTFPVGLVFLCCLPCTVRKRCNRCRRLFD